MQLLSKIHTHLKGTAGNESDPQQTKTYCKHLNNAVSFRADSASMALYLPHLFIVGNPNIYLYPVQQVVNLMPGNVM